MNDTPSRAWDYPVASPPPRCPHGTSYAQPCYGCGWACPTCGRNYAPWVRECSYSHENNLQRCAGTQPGTFTPVPPAADSGPAAVDFRFPGDWARPHYQHLVRACGEWRNVAPGLQVHLGPPAPDGEDTILHFRLTPEGDGR